jgi:hypothetical protein
MKRSLIFITLALLALACALPALRAQDGLQGAVARAAALEPSTGLAFSDLLKRPLAAADFDGDHQADGALLLTPTSSRSRSSYRVEVHLSRTSNTELTFESNDDVLAIAALDINNDGLTDLVVEQALTHRRLHVWLGDGQGGFRKVRAEDFSATDTSTGTQVSTPYSEQKTVAVSLPPQSRFETTLLVSGHISGRPPSTNESYHPVRISSPSLLAAASLATRAPPSLQSV